ncbi:hypothetical protein [Microbispora sp. NPDC049125]|uniref:hypothetical protein n=1 Tax=Microbispora sp. NPDC049125 TaxID=3154929 RepID=UPI0034670B32
MSKARKRAQDAAPAPQPDAALLAQLEAAKREATAAAELAHRRTLALREVIQEANGVLKDLERERKAVREFIDTEVFPHINQAVQRGLEDYKAALTRAINEGTERVYARFDSIADILLGADKRTQSNGKLTLEELARQAVEAGYRPPGATAHPARGPHPA